MGWATHVDAHGEGKVRMNKNLIRLFMSALAAVMLLFTMPTAVPTVKSQPSAPAFWVEPATQNFVENSSVGTFFNVTVWGAVTNDTTAWEVQLGFNASQLQAVVVGYTAKTNSEFFAHNMPVTWPSAYIDNVAGTIIFGEAALVPIGQASGSLFWVTFYVTVAPAQGQSLTSKIDPSGLASGHTFFLDPDMNVEDGLSTAACTYTYSVPCYLIVTSPYGSPSPSSGWFDPRTTVTASVTSPLTLSGAHYLGTRYVCTGWTGTGSVPASGSGSSLSFVITATSTITWNWNVTNICDLFETGIVDLRDISIAAKAFGTTPSDVRWNPTADINRDGKVDTRDIGFIAKNFGWTLQNP